MEEQIKKILYNKIELSLSGNYKSVFIDGQDAAAEEIASHVMKFIEWIIFECDLQKEVTHSFESQNEMIERLYNYWFSNIKSSK